MYVDSLIGPDTVNTMPEVTMDAFEDHGTLAPRAVEADVDEAEQVLAGLGPLGVDMGDVGRTLEEQGVSSFHESFTHVLGLLEEKARAITC